MNKELNCPNCGAPITGIQCEYCGTMFYDFAEISENKPKYLRLDFGGQKIWGKAVMVSAEINYQPDSLPEVEIRFYMLPDKKGNMIYFKEADT